MPMHFKYIEFGSHDYQQALKLRQDVLRTPLGLNILNDDLMQEPNHQHFGLFDDKGKILACASVVNLGKQQFQIRQMAVSHEQQKQGLGTSLLASIEKELIDVGGKEIVIEARDYAMGFYERAGYVERGEWFVKVGIRHKVMVKDLV